MMSWIKRHIYGVAAALATIFGLVILNSVPRDYPLPETYGFIQPMMIHNTGRTMWHGPGWRRCGSTWQVNPLNIMANLVLACALAGGIACGVDWCAKNLPGLMKRLRQRDRNESG